MFSKAICGGLLFLLLLGSTCGILKNPTMINYASFNFTQSGTRALRSVTRIDDASTSLFILVPSKTGFHVAFNLTLFIIQLDPQSGELKEDSLITVNLDGVWESYALESPIPGKAAIIMNSDNNSTVLIYDSNGNLEQLFQFEDTRQFVKPVVAPNSNMFNSLVVVRDPSYCSCITEVDILTWNGSQYVSQQYKYLDFSAHTIVGYFIYGVLSSSLKYLCQYDLQQVLSGNATNITCLLNADASYDYSIVASPAQNRLAWLSSGEPIYVYNIQPFNLLAVLQHVKATTIQLSEHGDLLFVGTGRSTTYYLTFTFQDISNLPVSQLISELQLPSLLNGKPFDFSNGVMTRNTQYTYAILWDMETTVNIIAYDTTPIAEPNIATSASVQYKDIIGDSTRGIIWTLGTNRIEAMKIDDTFTSINPFGPYLDWIPVNSEDTVMFWSVSNSSTYLIISGSNTTLVYGLCQWPAHNITLLETFPVPKYEIAFSEWIQLMWINGQLYKIGVQHNLSPAQYWKRTCLYNSSTELSCQAISLPDTLSHQYYYFPLFVSFSLAIAIRQLDIVIITSPPNNTYTTTVLYSYTVTTNTISLGTPIITNLVDNCEFVESRLVLETEIWFVCVSNTSEHIIYQFDCEQSVLKCVLHTGANNSTKFGWTVRDDGELLSFSTPVETRIYDISSCHANQRAFPVLRSVYQKVGGYSQIALVYANNADLQVYLDSDGLEVDTDCRSGMKPTDDHFCSQCTPGTAGILCQVCPGGYVCDDYGMVAPSQCPPSYYCVTGTNSSSRGSPGGPTPCIAGTYCPGGVALRDVNLTAPNTPHWCPQGYYCPQQSSLPDLHSCKNNSNTIQVGGGGIEDCVCNFGFWGHAGNCTECPAECECNGNVIVGCYVDYPDMIICPPYSINGSTSCNPYKTGWNGTEPFPCAKGYTGRLCSECVPNHYRQARQCVMCEDSFKWKLPLAYAGVSIVAMLYVWSLDPGNSAAILIMAFHFQTLYALINGGNQWRIFSSGILNSAQSTSSFSLNAIECVIHWWNAEARLLYFLLLPVLYLCFALCSCLASFVFHKFLVSEPKPEASFYKIRAAKMVVYLFSFNFFSVVMAIMSVLATHKGYLTVYPWLKYSQSLATIAYIGLIVEVIAVPFGIATIMWRNRAHLEEEWAKEVFGSLYYVYSPSQRYWELVIIARRFFVAVIVTFSPYNSPMLMLGTTVVVLIYMLAQVTVKPYARGMDNIFETASHFILACTLSISLMAGYPNLQEYAHGLVYSAIFLNTIFLGVGLIYTIFSFRDKISVIGGRIKEGIGNIQAYFGMHNRSSAESVRLLVRSHNT